jgi:large subunit ribosomal protein L20
MRVKKGVSARKKHNKIRKATKGYSRANRVSVRRGKQAVTRALVNATRDRKNRKRTFRALWNTRINAAARQNDTTYSKLVAGLKKNKIDLNRKILAELAVNEPKVFSEIIKAAKK